jgi:hypothetical protein
MKLPNWLRRAITPPRELQRQVREQMKELAREELRELARDALAEMIRRGGMLPDLAGLRDAISLATGVHDANH